MAKCITFSELFATSENFYFTSKFSHSHCAMEINDKKAKLQHLRKLLRDGEWKGMSIFCYTDGAEHSDVVAANVRVPLKLVRENYSIYDMIAVAIELCDYDYFKEALDAIDVVEKMRCSDALTRSDDMTCSIILAAAIKYIEHWELAYDENTYLEDAIRDHIKSSVPEANCTEVAGGDGIDIVVQNNRGAVVGIVLKGDSVTDTHVNKLRTYMNKSQVQKGYVIARTLSVNLPDDVEFLDISAVRDAFCKRDIF